MKVYPCDISGGACPYECVTLNPCRDCCGLGVTEEPIKEDYDEETETFLDYDR